MPKKKPSPRQQQILNLVRIEPEITAPEIAKRLKTSPGAVYQQISRLRSAGLLPKAGKRPAPKLRSDPPPPAEPKAASVTNGHLTVEQHLAEELGGIEARITEIEAERTRIQRETEARVNLLTEEQAKLTAREKRLDKANKALIEA